MRSLAPATVVTLGLLVSAVGHASQSMQKITTSQAITQLPYPAEVSLVHEQTGWTFRQSSPNLPLYLYEPGSSARCDSACEAHWAPLLAPPGERSLGDWTIFVRKDGRRQWAFERHPVYTHLHDASAMPDHEPADGAWHPMPHFRS